MSFDQPTYDALKKTLSDVIKKIENYQTRSLPSDVNERAARINTYKEELINAYNSFVDYVSTYYQTFDENSRASTRDRIIGFKSKIIRALFILDLKTNIPGDFEKIEISKVYHKDFDEESLDRCEIFVNLSNTGGAKSVETDVGAASVNQLTSVTNTISDTLQSNTPPTNENIPPQNTLQIPHTNANLNSLDQAIERNNMPLSVGDILTGIPDFDPKSLDAIKNFVARVDLMYKLSPDSADTILDIVRAKLVTANKLSTVENKSWQQIKSDIQNKYKSAVSFEVAQEKLLSVQQGPNEKHDAYANRVRGLLDSLNSVTLNANADIQNANRIMNEGLAIRKFKQNIFDSNLRVMALSAEHDSLSEAIAHAQSKFEQLNASNIQNFADKKSTDRKEQIHSNSNRDGNGKTIQNRPSTSQNNDKSDQKVRQFCKYCKKNSHSIENCRTLARKKENSNEKPNSEKPEHAMQSTNTAAAVPRQSPQAEPIAASTSTAQFQPQVIDLQPYNYLNC